MFLNILKFEIKYRKKRPATYIYFLIAFLFAFLSLSTDMVMIGSTSGKVMENSPVKIAEMMAVISAFLMLVTSAVMGVPVLRDFEHGTESLMFVNPIKKRDYLAGRFTGSLIVVLFIHVGMLLGFMLSDFAPWRDEANLLPFNLWAFISPFLIFVIPNIIFTGGLFFAGGTLSRKNIVVYTQGIFLLVVFLFASDLTSGLDNKTAAMLSDPFGISAIQIFSEYWTIAEQNSLLIPLQGAILGNRLLWLAIGIMAMIITYYGFKYNVVRNSIIRKKQKKNDKRKIEAPSGIIPKAKLNFGFKYDIIQFYRMSIFYFKTLFKELPFIAIIIFGLLLLFLNASNIDNMMGVHAYPTTYRILRVISNSFELFYIIIIVYFSGELIWKERSLKFSQITDATPIKDITQIGSKFFGLILAFLAINIMLILVGLAIQTAYGYFLYDIKLYVFNLLVDKMIEVVLFTLVIFFIQIIVNNKFLGYGVSVLFFILSSMVINNLGLEHRMFQFSSDGLGIFSDMNKYGHYIGSFSWFNVYWTGFATVLFILSVLLSVRGTDSLLKTRVKLSKIRSTRPIMIFILVSFSAFVLSGCYIYYNTNVVNEYSNSTDEEKLQSRYEKTLKKYQFLAQPRIVDTKLNVDIYPETRDFKAEGYYYLKNKTDQPIQDIHIQHKTDPQLIVEYLTFDRESVIKESYDDFRYFIYELEQPLAPGDSIKMGFKVHFKTSGFVEGGSNTDVVNNGTFFNNLYFPTLGYNTDFEISDEKTRKEYDLPSRERMLPRDSKYGQSMNLIGDDADFITFEIVLSTSENQTALAPGYLQKEWVKDGRRYFHYKMDMPMFNFYSMVSADYTVVQDKWNDVNLEVYYHKDHNYNTGTMMDAMKKSLDYYTTNFCPYQFRQMRIMEFPRYSNFAQSFANTVPFSEGIGFIMDIKDEDPNVPFFVTAHEFAHQWWGHRVCEANVQGNAAVSEVLAQYSAYMVIKNNFPEETLRKFLRYDMNKYLRGRSQETDKEMPLELVEQQDYIHYNKGALVAYALQDYISEDSVNMALRRFIKDWEFSDGIYPTSEHLIGYLKEVTPDSMQYLIKDFFQTITLYENKTEKVIAEKADDNRYKVTIDFDACKYKADSLGNEVKVDFDDYIYVGVFAEDSEGEDKQLYYKKHKISPMDHSVVVYVNEKPLKAGIDPKNLLIDRHVEDNTKEVELIEEV